jgi:hypothetical protein
MCVKAMRDDLAQGMEEVLIWFHLSDKHQHQQWIAMQVSCNAIQTYRITFLVFEG